MSEYRAGTARIAIVRGDITAETTDAIVNAANPRLAGGGGVDGAIHRLGGPQIARECAALGGCATGDAKSTSGGALAARRVIHAIGPIWSGAEPDAADALLASAYRRSLEVAAADGCRSVAFPSISTGAYGFPIDRAAPTALGTIAAFLEAHDEIDLVRVVLFSETDLTIYERAASEIFP